MRKILRILKFLAMSPLFLMGLGLTGPAIGVANSWAVTHYLKMGREMKGTGRHPELPVGFPDYKLLDWDFEAVNDVTAGPAYLPTRFGYDFGDPGFDQRMEVDGFIEYILLNGYLLGDIDIAETYMASAGVWVAVKKIQRIADLSLNVMATLATDTGFVAPLTDSGRIALCGLHIPFEEDDIIGCGGECIIEVAPALKHARFTGHAILGYIER